MRYTLITCLLFVVASTTAQTYTSYFTGNTTDKVVAPAGGICMMGGSSEHDEAMRWFLQQCNGGDVLVLRASGSNGYNAYMYSQLNISVNSVETIVCHSANASYENYLHQKIQQAEGIWFAGGDQWDYVSYWRNTAVDSLINLGIETRNMVIGGTSAGMAILGGYYFSAQNGTVSSSTALHNPYDSKVTVDSTDFIHSAFLDKVITDTHYDNPDRRGRHIAFLARILKDWGIEARGIACDEYTAVCVDPNGIAHIYGDSPSQDDNAYFIQINCELDIRSPEVCANNTPLTWNLGGTALKVYAVQGTPTGTPTFNLNNWSVGTGGEWQNWFVQQGNIGSAESDRLHCQSNAAEDEWEYNGNNNIIYPNPCDRDVITIVYGDKTPYAITLSDANGKVIKRIGQIHPDRTDIPVTSLAPGMYFISMRRKNEISTHKMVVY